MKNIRVDFEHKCSKLVRSQIEFKQTLNYSSQVRAQDKIGSLAFLIALTTRTCKLERISVLPCMPQ